EQLAVGDLMPGYLAALKNRYMPTAQKAACPPQAASQTGSSSCLPKVSSMLTTAQKARLSPMLRLTLFMVLRRVRVRQYGRVRMVRMIHERGKAFFFS